MQVYDAMSRNVRIAHPDDTICDAANVMALIDAGALPVGANDRLVGVITDRDIAIRAVAEGRSPNTRVQDVMSYDVCYCYEDQDLDDVAQNMCDVQVRRLPVLNRDKRLVGILSLGDLSRADGHTDASADALCSISRPGGRHSQTGNGFNRYR